MCQSYFAFILFLLVFSQQGKSDETVYPNTSLSTRAKPSEQSYCFRMTWLGPKFNNDSIFKNASCEELTSRAKTIPCRLPLIATYDGSMPNTTWLWSKYRYENPTHVACRLVQGEVCAKYIYSFNDAVENITYMCTKAYEEDGQAVTSGCYTQSQSGRDVKVCLCRTVPGSNAPCNQANANQDSSTKFLLTSMLVSIAMWQFMRYARFDLQSL